MSEEGYKPEDIRSGEPESRIKDVEEAQEEANMLRLKVQDVIRERMSKDGKKALALHLSTEDWGKLWEPTKGDYDKALKNLEELISATENETLTDQAKLKVKKSLKMTADILGEGLELLLESVFDPDAYGTRFSDRPDYLEYQTYKERLKDLKERSEKLAA